MHEELNRINKDLFSKIKGASDFFNESPDFLQTLIQKTINDWGEKLGSDLDMDISPEFEVKIDKETDSPLKIIPLNESAKDIIKTAKEMKLTDLL